jgi:hypothetical protein
MFLYFIYKQTTKDNIMKYLTLLLTSVLFFGCAANAPVTLMQTAGVSVYGCENDCPDSLMTYKVYQASVFQVDTLDQFDNIAVFQTQPDTLIINTTTLVQQQQQHEVTMLCSNDNIDTKRLEWQDDGWTLSHKSATNTKFLNDNEVCFAGTRAITP